MSTISTIKRGGNIYKELLWTNPNPANTFVAQNIQLNLSEYDEVQILCNSWQSESFLLPSVTVPVGASGILLNNESAMRFRRFGTSSSGVNFDSCNYYIGYDNWNIENSDISIIPMYIYGIKYL